MISVVFGAIELGEPLGIWLRNNTSWVTEASDHYGACVPQNLMDGTFAFNSASGDGWNANGWGVNWVTFDFVTPRPITKFAYYGYGDTTHDVKVFDLQIRNELDLTWTTVKSFIGVAGTKERQEFGEFQAVARFWKWNIRTKYSEYQAYVTEVEFFQNGDVDNDGKVDTDDFCLQTEIGSKIDDNGCSIDDYCPCNEGWKNHGQYVRCVSQTANDFKAQGKITLQDKDEIVSAAGNTNCGH